ncbi:MAG: hypothetical protein ACOCZ6_04510 [Nanoarchaeota archaeon]
MSIKKTSQASVEFIIIIGIVLVFFLAFFAAINDKSRAFESRERELDAKSVVEMVGSKINEVYLAGNNSSATMHVPLKNEQWLQVFSVGPFVEIRYEGGRHLHPLLTDRVDNVIIPQGELKLENINGRVHITPEEIITLSFFNITSVKTNSPVEETKDLIVNFSVKNTGDEEEGQILEFLDFDNLVVDSKYLVLDVNETVFLNLSWETDIGDAGMGNITIRSLNENQTREVDINRIDSFFEIEIVESNEPVFEGDLLNLSVDINNQGVNQSTQNISLYGFSELEDLKEVTIDGESSETIDLVWNTSEGDAGIGDIKVQSEDNEEVKEVEVIEPVTFFEVEILDTSSPIESGEELIVTTRLNNTGNYEDIQTIELIDFYDDVVDESDLSLGPDQSEVVNLTWHTDEDTLAENNITVKSEDDEESKSVSIGTEVPFFEVDILQTDSPIREGDSLTVEAEIENTGEIEYTQEVELLDFEGEVVDAVLVTLHEGDSERVTLTWDDTSGFGGIDYIEVQSDDQSAVEEVTVVPVDCAERDNLFDACEMCTYEGDCEWCDAEGTCLDECISTGPPGGRNCDGGCLVDGKC